VEVNAMGQDDRDLLEILKEELSFIEKGGYVKSVQTPWLEKSVFQDSISCLNYGYPYRAHPCEECHLIEFVAPEDRAQPVPCHHIPLDERGYTVEVLESEENQLGKVTLVKAWLRNRISEIEAARASQTGDERIDSAAL
jgi:hypothetical protein